MLDQVTSQKLHSLDRKLMKTGGRLRKSKWITVIHWNSSGIHN